MTPRQLATAAGADLKWLLNSAALLGRSLRQTPADARWWGIVRLLSETLGLPLQPAAAAATRSLAEAGTARHFSIGTDPSESASVVIDLLRFQSIFLANLSRALVRETPRRRGRPSTPRSRSDAVDAAARYGVDIGLVRSALQRTPAQRLEILEANAGFLRELKGRRS
jgi:hypothetical protein